MSDDDKKILIEDVGGELGFRVSWSYAEHWADFRVFKVKTASKNGPTFAADIDPFRDETSDITRAECHLEGFVKWDGCCEFWRPLDSTHLHCCGANDVKMMMALFKYLYCRASELMNTTEDPWNADDKKLPDFKK